MHSRLFFGTIELGEVTRTDFDFPWEYGTFRATTALTGGSVHDLLKDYMQYSLWFDRMMTEERTDELETPEALAEEERFISLIDTDDWFLLDGDIEVPILLPQFGANSRIAWRWNHSVKQS